MSAISILICIMSTKFSLFLIVSLALPLAHSFNVHKLLAKLRAAPNRAISRVEKLDNRPILKVVEPYSQCRVHLIGVSHGSATSAELVQETIAKVRPSTIVVELCDERYLSICLDSKIAPNVDDPILLKTYYKKLEALKEKEELRSKVQGRSLLTAFRLTLNLCVPKDYWSVLLSAWDCLLAAYNGFLALPL